MKFSIIIPTFNRKESLISVLKSIEAQTFPKDGFEVLVIDDGSSDGTKEAVEAFKKSSSLDLNYFFQLNSGPARARNLGIEKSQGEIILFCGDDTIFDPKLLINHALVYQREKEDRMAVLGIALWSETDQVNDFMKFISPAGPQFHFNTIKNVNAAGWFHFYTCNISVLRSALGDLRFDTDYPYAAFEDIDLGWLLAKRGLKIFFNRQAIVYHSHFYEPRQFYERMINVGRSFVIFSEKHKKQKLDFWQLKFKYAPFDFFPGQLWLFNFLTKLLAESKLLEKFYLKGHWYFNICYYYSLGIIKEKEKYE